MLRSVSWSSAAVPGEPVAGVLREAEHLDRGHPYDAILAARPQQVRLVVVDGVVSYGDTMLQAAGPAQPGCELIDICGTSKFACVATTATANKLDQTYAQIKGALGQAMLDADAQTPADGYTFAPLPPIVTCN